MSLAHLSSQTCSVARALSSVGDPWTLMVVRELFLGSRRFDEIEAHTDISPHLLSVRLRELLAAGVVERQAYQQRPVRYEYRLTPKGLDLWGVISALREWGDRWGEWPGSPPVRIRHRGCGKVASSRTVCGACGEPMGVRDVEVLLSREAKAARHARGGGRPRANEAGRPPT